MVERGKGSLREDEAVRAEEVVRPDGIAGRGVVDVHVIELVQIPELLRADGEKDAVLRVLRGLGEKGVVLARGQEMRVVGEDEDVDVGHVACVREGLIGRTDAVRERAVGMHVPVVEAVRGGGRSGERESKGQDNGGQDKGGRAPHRSPPRRKAGGWIEAPSPPAWIGAAPKVAQRPTREPGLRMLGRQRPADRPCRPRAVDRRVPPRPRSRGGRSCRRERGCARRPLLGRCGESARSTFR